jgi:hypothetical protein
MKAGLAGPDIGGKSELDAYARPKINEDRKLKIAAMRECLKYGDHCTLCNGAAIIC